MELFREKNDLTGVMVEVAHYLVNGDEDGGVPPCAGGLRVDDLSEAGRWKVRDDLARFVDCGAEVCEGGDDVDGWRESELIVAAADVRLIVDAVKDPLADVAFEMQKEVAHGVLVWGPALPDLFFSELVETGGDGAVKRLHLFGGVGEEIGGDDVVGHRQMIVGA